MTRQDEILTEVWALIDKYTKISWDGKYEIEGPLALEDLNRLKQLSFAYKTDLVKTTKSKKVSE